MFDSVNHLAKRLPHPEWKGDPFNDQRAMQQYIANGQRLRSEAVASMGRALIARIREGLRRIAHPIGNVPSHQA